MRKNYLTKQRKDKKKEQKEKPNPTLKRQEWMFYDHRRLTVEMQRAMHIQTLFALGCCLNSLQ